MYSWWHSYLSFKKKTSLTLPIFIFLRYRFIFLQSFYASCHHFAKFANLSGFAHLLFLEEFEVVWKVF